jgi:hypothetical protein
MLILLVERGQKEHRDEDHENNRRPDHIDTKLDLTEWLNQGRAGSPL